MPLMGSLYVGASGLQTSQNALHTTAHNLSNIETTGYVRQQVLMADTAVYVTSLGDAHNQNEYRQWCTHSGVPFKGLL